jgi:hypothetical protein
MFRDTSGQGFLEIIYLYVHTSKCCFIGIPFISLMCWLLTSYSRFITEKLMVSKCPHPIQNLEVHSCVNKCLSLDSPVVDCFGLQPRPVSFIFSVMVSFQMVSHLFCSCYLSFQVHWFVHCNNYWWKVQITELLIIISSLYYSSFFLFRPDIFSTVYSHMSK